MTLISTTIRPDTTLDVDDAELESLTRQNLIYPPREPAQGTGNLFAGGLFPSTTLYPSLTLYPIIGGGLTGVQVTEFPSRLLYVDAAELESLTGQGLVVGVSAPARPASPPDTITAYVVTTINPQVVLDVGDAELESLTRQGLLYTVGHGYGTGGYGTSPYGV